MADCNFACPVHCKANTGSALNDREVELLAELIESGGWRGAAAAFEGAAK